MSEFTVVALTYACICDRLIFLARGFWTVLTIIYYITPRYISGNDLTNLKRLFAVILLRKPWYDCGAVGFVADKMELEQVSGEYFCLPRLYHSAWAPYTSIRLSWTLHTFSN
jgi:hypothetical protein